jgi:hypothetical protein
LELSIRYIKKCFTNQDCSKRYSAGISEGENRFIVANTAI